MSPPVPLSAFTYELRLNSGETLEWSADRTERYELGDHGVTLRVTDGRGLTGESTLYPWPAIASLRRYRRRPPRARAR
jgi:hypothetical protein